MRPRRVLVVQTAYLGDLVLTTPLIEAVRRGCPDATIHLVTTPGGAALIADDPRVSSVDSFDKRQTPSGILSLLRLAARVRSLAPDVAIAAQRSWRSGWIVRASGADRRIGFRGAAGAWAYTEQVGWDPARHQSERYLALASGLASTARDATVRPSLDPPESAIRAAARRLRSAGLGGRRPWVGLAPGSARPTKRWPVGRFAELARTLASRGFDCCVVGSADERPLADAILHRAREAAPRSLVGEIPLGELPATLALARALVGNDSAPAHIAAAVGTPTVTLFGPTDPDHGYAPRGAHVRLVRAEGPDCRPCSPRGPRRCPRGDLACLAELPSSRVVDALDELVPYAAPRELVGRPG